MQSGKAHGISVFKVKKIFEEDSWKCATYCNYFKFKWSLYILTIPSLAIRFIAYEKQSDSVMRK